MSGVRKYHLARSLDGILVLLCYLEFIEREYESAGRAIVWGDEFFVHVEREIRDLFRQLGHKGYLPPVQDFIDIWHREYGTPRNVASGRLPGGFQREVLKDTGTDAKEVSRRYRVWLKDWTQTPAGRKILATVRQTQYKQPGEEFKRARLSGLLALPATAEPGLSSALQETSRPELRPEQLRNPHIGQKSYKFIRSFVSAARESVDVVSYSVSERAVRELFDDIKKLERVRFFAERFYGRPKGIKQFLESEKGVAVVETHQCSFPLHAKLVLRDPGQEGAILVGSANLSLASVGSAGSPGRFEICLTSDKATTVTAAKAFVSALSGGNPPPFAVHESEGFLHSFAGGGIPSQLIECARRANFIRVYNPFFVDQMVYALVAQARRNRRDADGAPSRTWLEFCLGWPSTASSKTKRILGWLSDRDKEAILSVKGLDDRFHGKVYLFKLDGDRLAAIVSSANVTRRSLVDTIECGLYTEDPTLTREIWDRLSPWERPTGIIRDKGNGPPGGGSPPELDPPDDIVNPSSPLEGPSWDPILRELESECQSEFDFELEKESTSEVHEGVLDSSTVPDPELNDSIDEVQIEEEGPAGPPDGDVLSVYLYAVVLTAELGQTVSAERIFRIVAATGLSPDMAMCKMAVDVLGPELERKN